MMLRMSISAPPFFPGLLVPSYSAASPQNGIPRFTEQNARRPVETKRQTWKSVQIGWTPAASGRAPNRVWAAQCPPEKERNMYGHLRIRHGEREV
jgi:hypothetical protein